jgi:hypothetical protein
MRRKKPTTKAGKRKKAAKVMREGYAGELKMGRTGKKVPKDRPDIMKAIAMSESGQSRRRGSANRPSKPKKKGYRERVEASEL